ncbi:MAG: MOSC domain-containing protein [Epsilonproteobacteria bacterium]|nr:MOSC domain-containing protein [Campylobacterota bacterium]
MELHAIIIGRNAKLPLLYQKSVEVVAGKGIVGDRYYYGEDTFNKPQFSQNVREITLIDTKSLDQCNARLQSKLDFLDLRRNLVIKDMDSILVKNSYFIIGSAEFKVVRTCPPCRYLSRLLDVDMMVGLKYIGGLRAKVIKSGVITVGDKVELLF